MFGGGIINTTTRNSGNSGDVSIFANSVTISGQRAAEFPGSILELGTTRGSGIYTRTVGSDLCVGPCGNAGNITIVTDSLNLDSGGTINSGTTNPGSSGNVMINATNSINISGATTDGTPSGIYSRTIGQMSDAGAGGNITLSAGQSVSMSNGAAISTSSTGPGNAGNITLQGLASPANSVLITGMDENFNPSGIFTDTQGTGAGGDIFVNANSVTLQNGGTLSASTLGTEPTATGGAITIDAETLSMDGATITAGTLSDNTGRAGDVTISAKTIDTANFSFISTFSSGIGQAGDISLKATDRITLIDSFVNSDAASFSTTTAGNGGLIHLRAPMIDLQSSLLGTITLGAGNAGNLLLEAQQLNIQASEFGRAINTGTELAAQTQGSGNAGTITIRGLEGEGSSADAVTITDASRLSSRTSGAGNAGNISIAAAQLTLTEGANLNSSTQSGTGAGGSINLFTETFVMQNGSTLSAETTGAGVGGTITVAANQVQLNKGGLITAASTGAGAGGSITIGADSAFVSNDGTVSSTATQATGGDITISAGQSATLTNGSSISASSTGTGNAGNILINAGQNYTSTDSAVTTQAAQSSGGNITVLATDTVHLTNSQLNASVQGSSTTVGGNITIDPQYVILQNSQILAQATQGQGGAISLTITNGGLFLPDATSIVSASSQFGVNGTVTIQSPNAPGSGQVQPLGKSPLLPTSLLNQHCASLAGGEFSSFTVAGRDSLPTEPGSWLASPLYAAGVGMGLGVKAEGVRLEGLSASAGQVASGQWRVGDTPILSLRQIAPAGFLTQSFAVDWSAGCTS
jgi:large exoprotein involved in heme utilization and adhesion